MLVVAQPASAQDVSLPPRMNTPTKKNKFVPNAEYATIIADRINEGLLAVFPPDGYSGFQFKGQTTVIPAADRFAINLPSLSVLKPELGVRFDIGDISMSAKILVDPTVEDHWRFDVAVRLPSMIVVRDAVSNAELSRILIGKHDINGTFEAKTRHFSALKMAFDSLIWQQEMPPDPTDPDYTKPGYAPKPRILAAGKDIALIATLAADEKARLSGPISLKIADARTHNMQTGSKVFSADLIDWNGEIRKIDVNQYSPLMVYLGQIFTVGVQGYPDKGPKIDEIKRTLFFDDLSAKIASVKPLFDGFDSVLNLQKPFLFISDKSGEVNAQDVTFGVIVDKLMTEKAQIGLRFISNKAEIKPVWARPDLFPQNLDFRLTIGDIPSAALWKVFADLPADMKRYGELPSLDYAWNKFFYVLAKNRASIVVDKSIFRSKDLDAEFVMRGQFVPASPYLMAGVANVNLIGVDELASKTARAANNIVPTSITEQATRKKMYEMSKGFARLRDVGNRGIQREKGMTRRYNVDIQPNGAVVFSSNNGSMDVRGEFFR